MKKIIFAILGISILTGTIACVRQQASVEKASVEKASGEKTSGKKTSDLPKLKNPRIVIKKGERALQVFDGESLIKTYKIALGFAPDGDKVRQGDGKTPEGTFYIFTKNDKSKFYLSLGVSYPNAAAAERGLQSKLITKNEYNQIMRAVQAKRAPPQNTRLGGEIYIHGGGSGSDWTWGCAALENAEIKELFDHIPVGTPIEIAP